MAFDNVQKHPRYRLNAPVDVVTASAHVEELPLENISLGGAFIRTTHPPPAGSPVRLRIRSGGGALGLMGRVVHVIEPAQAEKKAHPAGMGVQFEGLSPETQHLLERFVGGLVEAARRERSLRGTVVFLPPATVRISDERGTLAALWQQGLERAALYVESSLAPPIAARVSVVVGALTLQGDVVHVDEGKGFGVQVLDLDMNRRTALARFVDGTAPTLAVEHVKLVGPPLGKVLAAARRLFTGIEEDDPFGGIGLPATATADEVRARCEGMSRLFAAPHPDASPPQAARVEAACRAVARLEPVLLARVAAMRKEAELAMRPPVNVDEQDQVRELLADAAALDMRGQSVDARRALERAHELAPDDDVVKRRLGQLNEKIDLAQAVELVKSAEVFAHGVGMKEEAVKRALQAARLTTRRDVRLLAVRVLAKAGEHLQAVLIAEQVVDADPKDALALQALLLLHERAKDWRAAARTGEALLRLKPGDAELQRRVKKIVEQARRW